MKFLDKKGLSDLVAFTRDNFIHSVSYDSVDHLINFYNGDGDIIGTINASNFIKDGMVSNVTMGVPESGTLKLGYTGTGLYFIGKVERLELHDGVHELMLEPYYSTMHKQFGFLDYDSHKFYPSVTGVPLQGKLQ